MIGGTDTVVRCHDSLQAVALVTDYFRALWPFAVVEDERPAAAGILRERFIYRDQAVLTESEQLGIVDELRPSVVHLLASQGQLTIVWAEPTRELKDNLEAWSGGRFL